MIGLEAYPHLVSFCYTLLLHAACTVRQHGDGFSVIRVGCLIVRLTLLAYLYSQHNCGQEARSRLQLAPAMDASRAKVVAHNLRSILSILLDVGKPRFVRHLIFALYFDAFKSVLHFLAQYFWLRDLLATTILIIIMAIMIRPPSLIGIVLNLFRALQWIVTHAIADAECGLWTSAVICSI
jgi:hypothetical protein